MSPARAVLEECTDAIAEAVRAERARCGSVKQAIARSANRFGLSVRRIEAFWWREASAVQAHEADAIRRAIAALHANEAARLAADLERHRAAHKAARAAIRPTLQLVSPTDPVEQGRLAL